MARKLMRRERTVEPKAVMEYLVNAYAPDTIARELSCDVEDVKEILANRRFIDKMLWQTVQVNGPPDMIQGTLQPLMDMLAEQAPRSFQALMMIADDPEATISQKIKVHQDILNRTPESAMKTETVLRHELGPQTIARLEQVERESNRLMEAEYEELDADS